MILESLFVLIYAVGAGVSLWSGSTLKRFLAENRVIGDSGTLDRFKALARTQMHLALFMAGVLTTGMVVGLALVLRYGVAGLGPVLLANLVIVGLAMLHKKVETRVRGLPTAPDELAREVRRVSESWDKKALPDF